ncbi:MAG: ferredoxin [Paracoccaceae bacterium]
MWFFKKRLTDKTPEPRALPEPPDPDAPRDPRDKQDRGGFFIEPSECITCGCCEAEAPHNIGTLPSELDPKTGEMDNNPSSYVKKQPETPEELAATVTAAAYCMVDCIYYGGDDPEVLRQWLKHWTDQDAYQALPLTEKWKSNGDL